MRPTGPGQLGLPFPQGNLPTCWSTSDLRSARSIKWSIRRGWHGIRCLTPLGVAFTDSDWTRKESNGAPCPPMCTSQVFCLFLLCVPTSRILVCHDCSRQGFRKSKMQCEIALDLCFSTNGTSIQTNKYNSKLPNLRRNWLDKSSELSRVYSDFPFIEARLRESARSVPRR